MNRAHILGTLALVGLPVVSLAAVDGAIGSEWLGSTIKTVTFNPAAAEHNFGSPSDQTKYAAYDTYFRAEAGWVHFAVATNGGGGASAGNFSNLYIGSLGGGSNIGFEATLNRFFIPGVPGYFDNGLLPMGEGAVVGASAGVIEVAIPYSFFQNDPLGMGFTETPLGGTVRWNLSQSFGYSVVGGQSFYGDDRLGAAVIPAPGAGALALLGVGAMASRRRRN